MPMSYLRPWTQSYSYKVSPSIVSTQGEGKRVQAKRTHRKVVRVSVERRLYGAELPYFESFIKSQANSGAGKFTDTIADHSGTRSATIRIVNGTYTVNTDGINHTVSCEIEVF